MMRIRQATSDDIDAVVALWAASGMLAYTPDPRGDIAGVLAHDAGLLLVAEAGGGALVGTVTGTYDGRRGWLMRLAVDPAHRRAGVGRALVGELERRMAKRGAPQVNLLVFEHNSDALSFWQRVGYEPAAPVRLLSKRLDAARPGCC